MRFERVIGVVIVAVGAVIHGCGGSGSDGFATGSSSSGSGGAPANSSSSTTASSSSGAMTCIPGDQKTCACPGQPAGGVQGAQVCAADGSGFGLCVGCDGATGSATSSAASTS